MPLDGTQILPAKRLLMRYRFIVPHSLRLRAARVHLWNPIAQSRIIYKVLWAVHLHVYSYLGVRD